MTQNYLGIRNGVVVCVQHVDQHEFSGEFHHAYDRDPVPFSSEVELLIRLDEFFDSLKFPFSATSSRNFIRHANTPTDMITEEDRVMEDKDILMNHGEVGTFIIRVRQRQALRKSFRNLLRPLRRQPHRRWLRYGRAPP